MLLLKSRLLVNLGSMVTAANTVQVCSHFTIFSQLTPLLLTSLFSESTPQFCAQTSFLGDAPGSDAVSCLVSSVYLFAHVCMTFCLWLKAQEKNTLAASFPKTALCTREGACLYLELLRVWLVTCDTGFISSPGTSGALTCPFCCLSLYGMSLSRSEILSLPIPNVASQSPCKNRPQSPR